MSKRKKQAWLPNFFRVKKNSIKTENKPPPKLFDTD